MNGARATQRGYLLVHVVMMFPLAALLLLILGRLIVDTIYLQRVAAEHANLVAVEDALVSKLRQDARAAVACDLTESTLTLQIVGRAGPVPVTYTLAPELVRRTTPDGDERAWQCWRLRFAWRVESGPRGDVLWLDLLEAPPPRRTTVLPRSFTASVLLPPGRPPAGRAEVGP